MLGNGREAAGSAGLRLQSALQLLLHGALSLQRRHQHRHFVSAGGAVVGAAAGWLTAATHLLGKALDLGKQRPRVRLLQLLAHGQQPAHILRRKRLASRHASLGVLRRGDELLFHGFQAARLCAEALQRLHLAHDVFQLALQHRVGRAVAPLSVVSSATHRSVLCQQRAHHVFAIVFVASVCAIVAAIAAATAIALAGVIPTVRGRAGCAGDRVGILAVGVAPRIGWHDVGRSVAHVGRRLGVAVAIAGSTRAGLLAVAVLRVHAQLITRRVRSSGCAVVQVITVLIVVGSTASREGQQVKRVVLAMHGKQRHQERSGNEYIHTNMHSTV